MTSSHPGNLRFEDLISPSHEIIPAELVRSVRENIQVKSLYLKPIRKFAKPKPGQFVMIWVPDLEEIPMSISGYYGDVFRISVAAVGPTTRKLHSLAIGSLLGVKGPLGNGVEVEKKRYLLIGGGYGVAPLIYAMGEIKRSGGEARMIIGARTKDFLLMVKEAEKLGRVYVSTDDGSEGFHGTALDLAKKILLSETFDEVLVCGPEPLLVGVAKLCLSRGIKCRVFAERYMKCGVGLCGTCVLNGSGLLVCKDGPVFEAEKYLEALGEL